MTRSITLGGRKTEWAIVPTKFQGIPHLRLEAAQGDETRVATVEAVYEDRQGSDSAALKLFWQSVRALESDGSLVLYRQSTLKTDASPYKDIQEIWLDFWAAWKQHARNVKDIERTLEDIPA